jgi:diguanylate cyclase (GGDEF)-like protein
MEDRYVMLVILAKSLFKKSLVEMQDFDITLFHSDFDRNDVTGHLYRQLSPSVSFIESTLFPKLSFNRKLNSETQPFLLSVEKQLGWGMLNWWLLFTLAISAVITFYVLTKYAKNYHLSEINRLQEADNLFYLANHDSLTGLPNRNLLIDRLRHAISQAERKTTKLAILFMDLNDFKKINDSYGHEVGDKLLKSVSERLLACIRDGDTLARRSGDEFILILENIENESNIKLIIEKIHAALERSFNINNIDLKVSISIGLALYPDDGTDYKSLLNIADQNMYKNKC